MPTTVTTEIVVLPEFDAADLGIPFKVKLLDSVKQITNTTTGEVEKTIIPNVPGLIECAAMRRILVPRKLSGPELKFIRKAFKVPAKKLAETIGVSPEHLSRCEAGERVLSAGAEKCLRISVFMDNNKLPDDVEDNLPEKNEKISRAIKLYRSAFNKIADILNEMKISSAHAVGDELVLYFKARPRSDGDLFDDEKNADWSEGEQLKAA